MNHLDQTLSRFDIAFSLSYRQGIFTENKERLIKDALIVLLSRCPSTHRSLPTDSDFTYGKGLSDREVRLQLDEARFHAIRRLVASKAGFEAFTQLPGSVADIYLPIVLIDGARLSI